MMASTQANSVEKSAQLHRIFRYYDPEVTAVVAIFLGLFQVLLAVPIYFIKFRASLYILPLIIGVLYVTGGSFAFVCSKSPDRRLLKGCAYSSVACLLGALIAVCVYIMALCTELPHFDCSTEEQIINNEDIWTDRYIICAVEVPRLHEFFHGIVGSLLVYDIAAVILYSLLSYSAIKGLKIE